MGEEYSIIIQRIAGRGEMWDGKKGGGSVPGRTIRTCAEWICTMCIDSGIPTHI